MNRWPVLIALLLAAGCEGPGGSDSAPQSGVTVSGSAEIGVVYSE